MILIVKSFQAISASILLAFIWSIAWQAYLHLRSLLYRARTYFS